ncbi:MAG: hypothetical protein WA990_09655 [Rubrobacteraceae bacterium]
MKRMFRRIVFLGVLAGAAVAVRSYLQKGDALGEEVVQLVFDDGSTHALHSRSVEGQEFTDIARKVVEIGL